MASQVEVEVEGLLDADAGNQEQSEGFACARRVRHDARSGKVLGCGMALFGIAVLWIFPSQSWKLVSVVSLSWWAAGSNAVDEVWVTPRVSACQVTPMAAAAALRQHCCVVQAASATSTGADILIAVAKAHLAALMCVFMLAHTI